MWNFAHFLICGGEITSGTIPRMCFYAEPIVKFKILLSGG